MARRGDGRQTRHPGQERLAGLDDLEQNPLLMHLLDIFGLDRRRLVRLAFFLLAHTLIDRHLMVAIVLERARAQGGIKKLDEAAVDTLMETAARRTFKQHLEEARRLGHAQGEIGQIAESINKGRDEFLHWEPTRYRIPKYRGQDVTTEAGLTRCLVDAFKVMSDVPFKGASWGMKGDTDGSTR